MNKQQNPNQKLIQFMLRAQRLSRHDASDKGYAMMMTSLISIAMFSMLAAYMTMTNLSKSSTNAYVDGTNTFYVAESGLNKRAQELREKFTVSLLPTSGSTSSAISAANPATASDCFATTMPLYKKATTYDTNNDFECRNYSFKYQNNSISGKSSGSKEAMGGDAEITEKSDTVNYVAYTFVRPKQDYKDNPPEPTKINTGETFAGLNALEYQYTVYSTARKPTASILASRAQIDAKAKKMSGATVTAAETTLANEYDTKQLAADTTNTTNANTIAGNSSHNTVLQMDFKSRVIPLFQFAAFYEDDLEMDSQMPMSVSGPIHTNGDLMAMSYSINQDASVDGKVGSPLDFTDSNVMAGTRLLGKVTTAGNIYGGVLAQTWKPGSCGTAKNCGVMAVYKGSGLQTSRDNYFYFPDKTFNEAATLAFTPSQVADFGDRMQDKSKGISRLNPPKPGFLREKNYFTNKSGSYYGKADMRLKFFPLRAMPFDFTAIEAGSGCNLTTYKISADRQGSSALSCSELTKGQLRSLQQPVLMTTSTTLSANDLDILKALKVAIASASGTPLTIYDLNQTINLTSTTLPGWRLVFKNLLSSTNQTLLGSKKPTEIATDRGSSFLSPPIQFISGNTSGTNLDTNSGFYNKLKGTWMTMLQTNIRSLTYWNRDGIYVEADSGNKDDLKVAYAAPTTLNLSLGLSTSELAFKRKAADTANTDLSGSFLHQGLAAADRTENGLVFHATVSDDTKGDGSDSGNTSDDITAPDTNDPVPGKDGQGVTIDRVDNYRTYPGISGKQKSPYAFVFSGGEELPGPLTIASDQAAYIQGDYNNPGVPKGTLISTIPYRPSSSLVSGPYIPFNGTAEITGVNKVGYYREPAAIIADTITILSNECLNNNGRVGKVGTGTVDCGAFGTRDSIASTTKVANGIAINAAFLSNLMKSGTRNSDGTYTVGTLNGGLNKYMRLLENWGTSATGAYYNYTGSMVSLGEPLESSEVPTGVAPKRNFNYDTYFNSFEKLPPLTPSAVYLQQDSFKRTY
jgi:hypothetical protein